MEANKQGKTHARNDGLEKRHRYCCTKLVPDKPRQRKLALFHRKAKAAALDDNP